MRVCAVAASPTWTSSARRRPAERMPARAPLLAAAMAESRTLNAVLMQHQDSRIILNSLLSQSGRDIASPSTSKIQPSSKIRSWSALARIGRDFGDVAESRSCATPMTRMSV